MGRGVAGELAKKKKEKKKKKIPKRGKNREKKGIERVRELKREIERAKGVRERERKAAKEFLLITSFYYKRAKAAHKQTQKKNT